ncbi:MAG: hypothetical protein E6G64_10675 [Actinobacteria bacterium]|nr:MAG: hypothetical protein E6G64_10675 [Actinomycetota bacterium]
MGSIAMDKLGDIALGYSISNGTTIFPGINYTGRQAGDPAGTMPQPETTLIAGLSSQTFNGSRWGDYSSMTVDPVDDCRFWYTTQYMAAGGFWATRIGAFRFSACDVPITASGTTINATEGASFSAAAPLAGRSRSTGPTRTPRKGRTRSPSRSATSIRRPTRPPPPRWHMSPMQY